MSRHLFEDLIKNFYILYLNGKLVITNKFYRHFSEPPPKVEEVAVVIQTGKNLVAPTLLGVLEASKKLKGPDMKGSPMKQFILDCEIPAKQTTKDGYYFLNKYSKEAEKEFIKILTLGYQYDILVGSTKLYYKSGGFPKTITNYLIEGWWKGCYEDLQTSLEKGNTTEYISKSLDNNADKDGFSRYKR